jgi:predicted 3-demethylubiquinone-9 3-methyltransferase (glyoxalase superfamily)
MQKTATFLMFAGQHCGKAEEAMQLYTSLFKNSAIKHAAYWSENEFGGTKGQIKHASFQIEGQEYMVSDSSAPHPFTFTPAISIFVSCENEDEITRLHGELKKGGVELMPLNNYGFSQKFAWVQDRFGVSWQLNLANS